MQFIKFRPLKKALLIAAFALLPAAGAALGYNNPIEEKKPQLEYISAEGESVYSRYVSTGCISGGGAWGGTVCGSKKVYYTEEEAQQLSEEIDERTESGYYRIASAAVLGFAGLAMAFGLYGMYESNRGENG